MEIVESYLAIERARFEERLIVHIDVASHLRALRVPPLLLQPLVENAVKHGIAQVREGGSIRIIAGLEHEHDDAARRLRVSVVDSGAGATPEEMARRRTLGTGLRNLEGRLKHYYAAAASLTVQSTPVTGTCAEVSIPVGASVPARGAAEPVSYGTEIRRGAP
jgi:sensor histidine kinase YesM